MGFSYKHCSIAISHQTTTYAMYTANGMTHGLRFREHYRPATHIGPLLTLHRGMSDMLYEHSDLHVLPRTMVDVRKQ